MPERRVHQKDEGSEAKGCSKLVSKAFTVPLRHVLRCVQLESVCRSILSLTLVLWWYTCFQA